MKRKNSKIKLNKQICRDLRSAINRETHLSITKPLVHKKEQKLTAWDRICSIMDRLDDTVEYLNNLKLNTGKYQQSAFDFYDFMNNVSVVLDCIGELAKQFDFDMKSADRSSFVFNKRGKDDQGTDKLYFEYLRSICSVHPIDTSHHERYQSNVYECCPFVTWQKDFIGATTDSDLFALIYTSQIGENKHLYIKISEIFNYIEQKYNLIPQIILKVEEYHENIKNNFRERLIISEREFSSYIDYLNNIIIESKKRIDDDSISILEYVKRLHQLEITNTDNQELYEKYCAAFRYAISFQQNALQSMSYDGYENSGIKFPDEHIETCLLNEIYYLRNSSELKNKYHYNFEKINYLSYDSGEDNQQWAITMIEKAMPFLGRFVNFNDAESNFELYVLVQLAEYQDCLESNCNLNRNIPNKSDYRTHVIPDHEYRILTQ